VEDGPSAVCLPRARAVDRHSVPYETGVRRTLHAAEQLRTAVSRADPQRLCAEDDLQMALSRVDLLCLNPCVAPDLQTKAALAGLRNPCGVAGHRKAALRGGLRCAVPDRQTRAVRDGPRNLCEADGLQTVSLRGVPPGSGVARDPPKVAVRSVRQMACEAHGPPQHDILLPVCPRRNPRAACPAPSLGIAGFSRGVVFADAVATASDGGGTGFGSASAAGI
jgi:hypothetical protein